MKTMSLTRKLALSVASAGLLTGAFVVSSDQSAQAVTFTIDTFDTLQRVDAPGFPPPFPEVTQVGGPGIVGGFRDAEATSSGGPLLSTNVLIDGGVFNFSNAAASSGSALLTWDGNDDPAVLDPLGLGGVDLTVGGLADRFDLEVISADLPGLQVTISITDMFSNTSSLTQLFTDPILAPSNEQFAFADLIGTADLSNVGSIQLHLDGPPEIDARIATFTTTDVPEPLTILGTLIAGSIGVAMKKRQEA